MRALNFFRFFSIIPAFLYVAAVLNGSPSGSFNIILQGLQPALMPVFFFVLYSYNKAKNSLSREEDGKRRARWKQIEPQVSLISMFLILAGAIAVAVYPDTLMLIAVISIVATSCSLMGYISWKIVTDRGRLSPKY